MTVPRSEYKAHLWRIHDLTPREQETLRYVAEGMTNGEIAAAMDISVNTVRHYLKALYGKLEIPNRYRLIVRAYKIFCGGEK